MYPNTIRRSGIVADVVRESIENALILTPAHAEFQQALEGFSEAIDGISNGTVTVLDALTDLQRRADAR